MAESPPWNHHETAHSLVVDKAALYLRRVLGESVVRDGEV
jgi:hypothetical protein